MVLGIDKDYEVCSCKRLTINDLLNVIKEHNITTLGQLQDVTFAGTHCRNCLMEEADDSPFKKKLYCKDILNYYKDNNG